MIMRSKLQITNRQKSLFKSLFSNGHSMGANFIHNGIHMSTWHFPTIQRPSHERTAPTGYSWFGRFISISRKVVVFLVHVATEHCFWYELTISCNWNNIINIVQCEIVCDLCNRKKCILGIERNRREFPEFFCLILFCVFASRWILSCEYKPYFRDCYSRWAFQLIHWMI